MPSFQPKTHTATPTNGNGNGTAAKAVPKPQTVNADVIDAAIADQDSTDPVDAFVSLLDIKTANESLEIASSSPIPENLFGDFWKQGQLAILFGESGKGKSILAVQIGDSISRGRPISQFNLGTGPQKVLYLDLELSKKQFEIRYSIRSGNSTTHHYSFHDNFMRGEIDYKDYSQSNFEQYLTASIEHAIVKYGVNVLIVDNITYLSKGTEKAQEALPLMKMLKKIKEYFHISILVLAHTPKRDNSRPLSINDLQGSAMLKNFADAIFGIGQSEKDTEVRYLIQFKQRDGRDDVHNASNVALCEIDKPSNFLGLNFTGFCDQSQLFNDKLLTSETAIKQKDMPLANFLKEKMSKGPVPAGDMEASLREAGFSKKSATRICAKLGIMSLHDKSFHGGWTWQYNDPSSASLEEAMQNASYAASNGNLGILGDLGRNFVNQESQESQERGTCKCGVGGNLGAKCFACGGSFEL